MKLRWGIIGCGNIAKKFAHDLSLIENNELYAVASRSIDRARKFAIENGASISYGDYKLLCEDKNIDIIYVATPHTSHMQHGLMAMEHGKHLLCEKPISINSGQLAKMIDTAKKNNVFMMEALWSRFNPSIVEILKRIKSGVIGQVTYINAEFYFTQDFDPKSRLFDPALGGGALLDIGIYPLFLSYLILGMPTTLQSSSTLHKNGVDLQTSAILTYPNAHTIISCGLNNNPKMTGRIHGDKGSIYLDSRWHEAHGFTTVNDKEKIHEDYPILGFGYSHEISECYNNIVNGNLESKLWSLKDSQNLMSLCDEVRYQNGIAYPDE